jgi:hypothetical protein
MRLREVVERYLKISRGYGRPVALLAFGLPRPDTEKLFSTLDEDYHISRFFHFSNQSGGGAEACNINGFPQTHVFIDAEIEETL